MASSTQGIRAGRAFVELFADDSKLVRGLKNAERKLTAFGSAVRGMGLKLAGIGTAVAAPMIAAVKSFTAAGSALAEMSARTGISVERLSELKFAAEQSGVSVEGLGTGIRKMQKMIVEAAKGSAGAQQNLRLLGLSIKDLDGLSPDQQFKLIADRLSQLKDPAIRAAMAMEVFGKTGTDLLPMMEEGAAGIDAMGAHARALGLVISTESAEAAHRFEKTLGVLWKVIRSGVNAVGSALVPTLSQAAKWVTKHIVLAVQWIKQNKDLVLWVFKVAAGVVAAGAALVGLGYIIGGIATGIGALVTIIGVINTVMSAIVGAIAFILSPIGLIIAAVTALASYIIYASGAGAKALGWLGDRWGELANDVSSAYQGICDALAAGDIGLAARILWLALKMEWQKGVNWISTIWNGGLLWLKERAVEAFTGMVMIVEVIWHGLEVAWIETTAFLSGVWTNFCAGITNAWLWVVKSLEETWNKIKGIFDSKFDAAAANTAVESHYQTAKNEMWDSAKKQLAAREEQRKNERESSAATHDATMTGLYNAAEAEKKKLRDEFDAKMKANDDELTAAKKEFQDSLKSAKDKRAAKEAAGPDKTTGPEGLLDELAKKMPTGGDLTDMANKMAETRVVSTFNAAGAFGLAASGSAADRTAKATETSAERLKKLGELFLQNRILIV